ncbi:MAG: glutamate racemase [Sphingobacteriales bacterium]|nr:glutamate racemase [Sphingobacteriales bacterium]
MEISAAAPIGVFDSGVGGLTVANAIAAALPHERLIYFGDTAHMPYGEKSAQTIVHYCERICEFLLSKGCKAIVIACNTASSVAYLPLLQLLPPAVPLINVIDPIVAAVQRHGLQHVSVIATQATIQSGVYSAKLRAALPHIEVYAKATRSLAQMIEEGLYRNEKIIQAVLEHYLADEPFEHTEGLILACTHYPLIKNAVQQFMPEKADIFDSPTIIAEHLGQVLRQRNLLSEHKSGSHLFYVSDRTAAFEESAAMFFGKSIHLEERHLHTNPSKS